MSHQINISSSYNMSLGLAPAILTILMGEFIPKHLAIYVGTLVGIAYSAFNIYKRAQHSPNFVLYSVTVIMAFFSLITWLHVTPWPDHSLAMTLEITIVLTLLLVYILKNKILEYFRRKVASSNKHHFLEATESAIVSIRITLIFAFIHFATLTLFIVSTHAMTSRLIWVLQVLLPLLTFVSSIVFNQLAIIYFNRTMSTAEFVPVANSKGVVTGKVIKEDIHKLDNKTIIPLVRIAIEYNSMLFLSRNNSVEMVERDKTDTPLESYVLFKETVEDTLKRVLNLVFPPYLHLDPRFSIKYKFKDENIERVVYLFIIHLNDDSLLNDKRFFGGKLWTLPQIQTNLKKNFFTDLLENEYDHLRDIIEIREIYKEP